MFIKSIYSTCFFFKLYNQHIYENVIFAAVKINYLYSEQLLCQQFKHFLSLTITHNNRTIHYDGKKTHIEKKVP